MPSIDAPPRALKPSRASQAAYFEAFDKPGLRVRRLSKRELAREAAQMRLACGEG